MIRIFYEWEFSREFSSLVTYPYHWSLYMVLVWWRFQNWFPIRFWFAFDSCKVGKLPQPQSRSPICLVQARAREKARTTWPTFASNALTCSEMFLPMNINSIFTDTLTRKCPLTSSSGSVCPTPHHIHPSDELFSLLAVYELICLSRLLYALREFVDLFFYQVVLTQLLLFFIK